MLDSKQCPKTSLVLTALTSTTTHSRVQVSRGGKEYKLGVHDSSTLRTTRIKIGTSLTMISAIFVCLSLGPFVPIAASQQTSSPEASLASAPPLSKQTRVDLIRILDGELVYVRVPFPMGREGLRLERGSVTPKSEELQKLVAANGTAAKPGDLVHISDILFRDHSIIFEINGGPLKKEKWYERVEIGGAGGTRPLTPKKENANSQGSYVEVVFDRSVPEMSAEHLKGVLRPVFDFDSKSSAEAYLQTVSPKVREALINHKVLVGMNQDMVLAAKDQPKRRIRDTDGTTEYEEWIYGEPPQEVNFIRFVGDEVVRIETMTVDGIKTVRTEKEIDIHEAAENRGTQGQSNPSPASQHPGEPESKPSGTSPSTVPPASATPHPPNV